MPLARSRANRNVNLAVLEFDCQLAGLEARAHVRPRQIVPWQSAWQRLGCAAGHGLDTHALLVVYRSGRGGLRGSGPCTGGVQVCRGAHAIAQCVMQP